MRKNAKERKNISSNNDFELFDFIKIILILLVILVAFSLITMFVTRDKKTNSGDNTEETIQYTKIIVGSILNRGEQDYYVLVENSDDENLISYESLISKYNNKSEHLRFYTVDLSDPFNNKYISEESKLDVDKITDIRFSETTLLHIQNGKIVSYRVGDNITSYLTKLSA